MKHDAFLLVASSTLVLLLHSTSVIAKNASIGIYAIVDRVTFEPSTGPPNSVRKPVCSSSLFLCRSSNYRNRLREAIFYFRITPETRTGNTARLEQNSEPSLGSGKVVGFGQYWVPNSDDPARNPHHSLEVTVHAEE